MNKEEVKNKLVNLVDISIYKSNSYYEEEKDDVDSIIAYLKDSKSVLEDIKYLVTARNSENYIYFNQVLIDILIDIGKEKKLNILYNSDIYINIFKEKTILLR